MTDAPATPARPTNACYRHADRPAAVGCTRCDRPICVDDMIDAPVGFLCPECARTPATQVRAARRVAAAGRPAVTIGLLGVIALAFLAQRLSPAVTNAGVLHGPSIAAPFDEWWRIVTSGFLHADLLHIGFNGYLLYQLGLMLEGAVGRRRFALLFAAGLFGGAAGGLILDWGVPSLGASGAVFGLMGAAMVGMRRRGVNPLRSSIGTLVLINLVFTFAVPGISIGGHVGGLIGGALAALPIFVADRGPRDTNLAAAVGVTAALAALALYAGVAGPLFG